MANDFVGLSVPTIKVNNDVIEITPNSFKYTPGAGEVTVRAASTGGGNAVAIHTQNAETMFSKVMFSMPNTGRNIELVRDWKVSIGGNSVDALQRGIGVSKDFREAFRHMSVTNDPEVNAAADGVIEVEMAGDKLE